VELGAHVGHNLTENGYMDSSQLGAGTRFHFSNRWNVGVDGSLVFNKLSAPGNRLLKEEGLIPDYAYTISRFDATAGFNTFYGKMRFDMDQVIYFDQYVTLGAGLVRQNTALARAAVSDIGFAFWIGKQGVVRLGVKNYLFKEVRQLSSSVVHHGLLHLDVNFLLGGST
jgi:outer membrane beta-barrel protein